MLEILIESIVTIIGNTAISLAAIFLFVKFLGKRWIEGKFKKDFERFRAQTDLLITRKVKWHEKEQEVLSESWRKLKQAHIAIKKAISMFYESPDLNNKNKSDLENFMNNSDFSDGEKEYMRKNSNDYDSAYYRVMEKRNLDEAHKAFLGFHTYFDENRIFIRPHIKEEFQKADCYIWSAWVSKHMDSRARKGTIDFHLRAFDKENKDIKPLVENIESIIQKELFPDVREA